ncbi:T9SS type A sorting domain-containing protein [Saprospiraceae bacterium]|nr:T9SS type A sorting domain-containing protein [Saprospiraceae bacterium]
MRPLLLLVVCSYCFATSLIAQQYGNVDTTYTGYSFNANVIITFSITTGSNDSGNFTDLGYYARPGGSAVRMALYSDNNGFPDQLLAETASAVGVHYEFNIFPLLTTTPLSPNTVYHIAMLTQITTQTASATQGNTQPIRYKTHNFASAFPAVLTNVSQTFARELTIYAIANNAGLPVELKRFAINKTEDKSAVLLDWVTSSEIINKGWSIDRSSNGVSWESIGWVEGAVNSTEEKHYEFLDKEPERGLSFYRITQEDLDGTKTSSDVRTILMDRVEVTVFPNPAHNVLHIDGINEATVTVFELQGKEVLHKKLDREKYISLGELEVGQYIVRVEYEKGLENFIVTKL